MLNAEQEAEIRDYLLSKKLPIDILLEVQDHFESQIRDFTKKENLDFDSAFENAKISWAQELSTTFPLYILNSNIEVARTQFEQTLRNRAQAILLRNSLAATFCVFIVIFVLSKTLIRDYFLSYLQLLSLFLSLATISMFLYNLLFIAFSFPKKYQEMRLSIYQWSSISLIILADSGLIYLKPFDTWIFNFDSAFFSKILLFFIAFWVLIYICFSEVKFAQTLRKIKPHLKLV